MITYKTEYFHADIPADEYIARFRDREHFIELCKQCSNYGNYWGCPPFEFDSEELLLRYKHIKLLATKIIPEVQNIPINKAQELLLPERIIMDKQLLELEKIYNGLAFTYTGTCLHCGGAECRRRCNKPCIHPDKVRPSLEAYGFDVERTLFELFDIRILWGNNGVLPPYLMLVGGVMYNK